MSDFSQRCWHNGSVVERFAASPSIASFSLHTGTAVFDGIMAYWNRNHYYLLEEETHFDRLRRGAAHLGMPIPWTTAELIHATHDLLRGEPARTYYIRPIVYRGAPELWFSAAESHPVDVSIFSIPVPRGNRDPVECELSPIERVSSRAIPVTWKICGLYVNSYLARRSAIAHGFKDGIMIDRYGRIAEASASNVFFIDKDELFTPPLNEDVFPGITRKLLLDVCRRLNIRCSERDIFLADLPAMKAAFLCSTLSELKPVSRLGEKLYDSANHPAFQAIAAVYESITAR